MKNNDFSCSETKLLKFICDIRVELKLLNVSYYRLEG